MCVCVCVRERERERERDFGVFFYSSLLIESIDSMIKLIDT